MSSKGIEIAVIGAGAYGTAMAHHLAKRGHQVTLWAREAEVVEGVRKRYENHLFLPGIPLSKNLQADTRLKETVQGKEIVVIAVPTQYVRPLVAEIVACLEEASVLVSTSKGIETATLKLLTDLYQEILPPKLSAHLVFLSGPSFAKELALGHPSAVAIASSSAARGRRVQEAFQTDSFFLDWTEDTVGVVLGGAMKNVIAIGCGMADGLGFGHSTRAMLMTRGLGEMVRLGMRLGANPETFRGLAGVGDLILTCTGELSRNRALGIRIAKGESLVKIRESTVSVAEGVDTSRAIYLLAKQQGVALPLCAAVYRILFEGASPRDLF